MFDSISMGLWFFLIIGAICFDWLIGDPPWIPHPVVYIGRLISFLTKLLNTGKHKKIKGLIMWMIVVTITAGTAMALQWISFRTNLVVFMLVNLYFLQATIAAKCLKVEVIKVAKASKEKDLDKARLMLSYLVGRDTSQLSNEEIVRATIETTAENTVDGVLAPLFYMVIGLIVFGFFPWINPLVLAMVYKAVNTMDSMVGYVQEPYKDFGYFPAKLDDIINYPIARLGVFFMLIAGFILGYDVKKAYKIYRRDCKKHKSPNAGHPESAVAGLLGVRLGGTNYYFGQVLEKPTLGDPINLLVYEEIYEATNIMYSTELVMAGVFSGIFTCLYFIF